MYRVDSRDNQLSKHTAHTTNTTASPQPQLAQRSELFRHISAQWQR